MKVDKVIKNTQPAELEVAEITLLSEEEYEAAKENIPAVNTWWWLRSPYASHSKRAGAVAYDGWVRNNNVLLTTERDPLYESGIWNQQNWKLVIR